jgi:hypothetical protein
MNTSVFDPNFTEAWGDPEQRDLMTAAFVQYSENSPDENILKACIWNANINSVLATSVLQYLGAKIPPGKTVGDLLNPWKKPEKRLTGQEKRDFEAKKQAHRDMEAARMTLGTHSFRESTETSVN